MDYEIITLTEKTVAGISARTSNAAPDMGTKIGGLWQQFYSPDFFPIIKNKATELSYGIYTDYADRENGDYTVMVACEVTNAENLPKNAEVRKIPAGKYARFIVKGNVKTAVMEFWQKLWKMELDRSFVCDFEEYHSADMENSEIHIYIGLREEV